MSGPSLTRQGEHVLESLPAIGRSRHAAKRANVSAEAIHSWGTSRTYLGRCYPFVHWAQDAYDLRRLTGLEPEMIAGYVGALRAGERAGGYVRGAPSAVGKLQAGINRRWRAGLEPIPEDLWAAGSEPRFGYGLDDARRIIAHVGGRDPLAALVLRGQLATGLRQDEALHLR